MIRLSYTRDGIQFEAKTVGQMVALMRHLPPLIRELEAHPDSIIECPNCGSLDLELTSCISLYCSRCGNELEIGGEFSGGGPNV